MEQQICMQSFKSGDHETFRNIIRLYERKIFALVIQMIRNQQEAEDLVQTIFLKVYDKRKSFKENSSLYTWVYRIAVNETINHAKKMKRKFVFELNEEYENFADNLKLPDRELALAIDHALASLPEKYRAIFLLREMDGLSYQEISKEMLIPVETLKVWLFRAKEKLQKVLRRQNYEVF